MTYGVQLTGCQNTIVDGNVIANVSRAREKELELEPTGGLIMNSFQKIFEQIPIKNTSVVNNIVAGTEWTGYTALGHACGKSES
jgi:hypothetical protein